MSIFSLPGHWIQLGMQWMYDHISANYALVIILFTFALKLITLPLDIKQRKSMARLSAAQPELQKLQKKYGGNPETLQKKQMEYMRENKISQFGGCLPMILMMVFFTVFFNGMNNWGYLKTIELYHTPTSIESNQMLWINNIWMPDSGLSKAIMPYSQFTKIKFDGLSYALDEKEISALKSVTEGQYNTRMSAVSKEYEGKANGWFILPLLAGLSMLGSQWLTQKTSPTPPAAAAGQAASPAGMGKSMMYIMSALFVFICSTTNAAYSIYLIASNLASALVTFLLNKTILPRASAITES